MAGLCKWVLYSWGGTGFVPVLTQLWVRTWLASVAHLLAQWAVQRGCRKFCGQSGAQWRREGCHCVRAAGVGHPHRGSASSQGHCVIQSGVSRPWECCSVLCRQLVSKTGTWHTVLGPMAGVFSVSRAVFPPLPPRGIMSSPFWELQSWLSQTV